MPRRLIAVAVAAWVVVSASGCDRGSADARADDDRLAACDLVQAGDVEDALGGDVRRPDATDDAGADALAGRSGCAWSTKDGASAALFELVRTQDMSTSVRRTGFSASARFNAARSRHPDADPEDLGDRAFWVEEMATLYVLVDSSYLVIEVATPDPDAARTVASLLAARAVTRLEDAGGQTDAEND